MVTQTGGNGFGHEHGQLQGVQFIDLPGCLGVGHGLAPFGSTGGFSGWTPWIGGGVASLAVPVLVDTLRGAMFISTLPTGVLGVPAFFSGVAELLASVSLYRLLLRSVFTPSNGKPFCRKWSLLASLFVVIFILFISRLFLADLILVFL